MIKKNIIITSSSNYSLPTLLLAELLIKKDINIVGIIAINLFSIKRIRKTLSDRTVIRPLIEKIINLFNIRKIKRGDKSSILMNFIRSKNLKLQKNLSLWCRDNNVPIKFVDDLNSPSAYNFLKKSNFDCVVYSGGGILKEQFIKYSKYVLNSHAGPLPEVRGMNAAEWSFLMNYRSAITIHFIDEGIDTGPIISSFEYNRKDCNNINQLRELALLKGIDSMVKVLLDIEFKKLNYKKFSKRIHEKQFYRMAPILLKKLELKIKNEKNI